jgi:outer membrane receptor protein involved in Fe transport
VNSFGVWEGLPQGREQKTYQFNNNFSMVKGKHYLKFGGEYYYLQADSVFDALFRPLAAVRQLRRLPARRAGRLPAALRRLGARQPRQELFLFAQDDWKVSRNLTLNLGIRMEYRRRPV